MTLLLRKIEQVTARPDYKISVMWTDGAQVTIDLSNDVKGSGVWRALLDYTLFQKVRVAPSGYAIEWGAPADEDGEPLLDIDSEGIFWLAAQQMVGPQIAPLLERLPS